MPTLLCVPIMVENPHEALDAALLARARGADLVEYRIDTLFQGEHDEANAKAVEMLVAESPLPCIITCRSASESGGIGGVGERGGYDGDDASRIALFEKLGALDHPPRYLDVELATLARSANLRQKVLLAVEHDKQPRDLSTSLILSVHDFDGRPADLFKKLGALRAEHAARVHKIAWRARSLRDNLELFEILRERDRPTIALGMGEFGLMSRVLAPKFGGFLTFASLRDEAATAPGQPTIDDLLNLYRFRSIDRRTRVYGVIGWPVAQSASPHIHNAGFEAIEWNGVYLPLPIPATGGGWEHFKATLGALLDDRHLDFSGCSVTIPHKGHLLRFAREDRSREWVIDPIAARTGAANTLVVSDEGEGGRCSVHNTDAEGVLAPLRERLGVLSGRRVGVIGAGGAARAAAVALADAGATVLIHNRTGERASELVAHINGLEGPHEGPASVASAPDLASCEVVINATPIGMTGGDAEGESALDASVLGVMDETAIIFDTVYNPPETPLIRAASERGLTTIGGREMFIAQAALQFRLWTGREAPVALFGRVLDETLPR